MLTPQEVEERAFPKVRKGGYDMQDVDNFLDQLTADYTELYKENTVLKRKMKVLADKIAEYQETEGAMRQTLLAAQRMADQIVAEAEQKRDAILAETEQAARDRVGDIAERANQEEARLRSARKSVADLTANIRGLLAQEEEFLANLSELEPEEEPAGEAEPETSAADAVAAEIGDSIARMMAEGDEPEGEETPAGEPEPEAEEKPAEEEAPAEEAPAAEPEAEAEEKPAEEEAPAEEPAPEEPKKPAMPVHRDDDIDDAPTRRLDLSELRFGRNYEIK